MNSILNIETASSLCSVSLCEEGKTVLYRESSQPNSHSSSLAVIADQVLKEYSHSISSVAVSIGPGSYTGLRIGLSLAKGLAYKMNIPLIAVPTLKIIASGYKINNMNSPGSDFICPMMDARRNEVYLAIYTRELKEVYSPAPVILDKPETIEMFTGISFVVVGNGAEKAKKFLIGDKFTFNTELLLNAASMEKLSYEMFCNKSFADLAYQAPEYLKEFEAIKPKNNVLYKGTQFDKSS